MPPPTPRTPLHGLNFLTQIGAQHHPHPSSPIFRVPYTYHPTLQKPEFWSIGNKNPKIVKNGGNNARQSTLCETMLF